MRTATGKIADTYENYTRLIKEIEKESRDIRWALTQTTDICERLGYYGALIKNDHAIDELAFDRLQMTVEAFAG